MHTATMTSAILPRPFATLGYIAIPVLSLISTLPNLALSYW